MLNILYRICQFVTFSLQTFLSLVGQASTLEASGCGKVPENIDLLPILRHDSYSVFQPPQAELAELVDALDSGSSVRKDFRVRVPGSAFCQGAKELHLE